MLFQPVDLADQSRAVRLDVPEPRLEFGDAPRLRFEFRLERRDAADLRLEVFDTLEQLREKGLLVHTGFIVRISSELDPPRSAISSLSASPPFRERLRAQVGVQGDQQALSAASRFARDGLRPLAQKVAGADLSYKVPKTLAVRLERTLATRVRYVGVNESPIFAQLRKLPGLRDMKWDQGHIFLQQRWFRSGGSTAWYGAGTAERLGLERLGNAGWNLMPLPRGFNQALGRSPWGSAAFGTGVVVVGGGGSAYAGFEIGQWATRQAMDIDDDE